MFILNATKFSKSLMTENGTIISVAPGEVSQLMIASRNMVIAAMKLGNPQEIGIILNGSYEMDLVKQITGAVPYLYTDIAEAKSKLIDPSIDYKGHLESNKANLVLEDKVKTLTEENSLLKNQISNLENELKLANASDLKLELENRVGELEKVNKDLLVDKNRISDQLTQANDLIKTQSESLNNLRKENGDRMQEMASQSDMINKLSEKVKSLELELENEKKNEVAITPDMQAKLDSYDDLESKVKEDESLISSLKSNLSDASNLIESMKTDFNKACSKFGLYRDESGEWVRDPEMAD